MMSKTQRLQQIKPKEKKEQTKTYAAIQNRRRILQLRMEPHSPPKYISLMR